MSRWALVLSDEREVCIAAQQTGGVRYPLEVEVGENRQVVGVHGEPYPVAGPLVLDGILRVSPTDLRPWVQFVADVEAATAVRYYHDDANYWERAVAGPIAVEELASGPARIRYRLTLAVTGEWLDADGNGGPWL